AQMPLAARLRRANQESCAGAGMSGLLTHEQLLQAVGHVAEASLPRWGLSGAALKMINHSENTTYLVIPRSTGANGARPVILRVRREAYQRVNGSKWDRAGMHALQAEANVLTPQAIRGQDGEEIQAVSHPSLPRPRNCVLFHLIDGHEPQQENLIEPFK